VDNLAEIMQGIDSRLETKNQIREQALSLSRRVIQHASQAIRAVHRHEFENARGSLDSMRTIVEEMNEVCRSEPDIYTAGYVQDAQKEYIEAHLTCAMVQNLLLPTPQELGVEDAAYLNGLGEAASEMRRYVLDLIRHNKMREAERLLNVMEDVYSQLMTVDFPHAITGNLRRTSDMLRGVLERTRGDLTVAMKQRELRRALRRFEKRIKSS
jgi:translin